MAAWLFLGLAEVPVVGGIGAVAAVVGGVQLLRIRAAESSQ